ncbi:MAG: hypothetical protein JJU45_12005 [Acidimicrobiia bacterium]|nr:hypothetical protein [Acidimicrobiia bacterium]
MAGSDTPERTGERRALETVLDVLPRSVRAKKAPHGSSADLIVGDESLRVEWVGEGSLGDVRPVLASSKARRPDIAVARRLSPGAREALTQARVGWVDETGAAEIAAGSIVVSRTGRTPKPPQRPKRWTPAVAAIAEALLCGTKATVSSTEAATGLSTGSCTNALGTLTELGLLEADAKRGRGSARRVADRDRLLEAYAAAVQSFPEPIALQVGVTWRDPVAGLVEVGRRWSKAKLNWAATGAAAASVLAPYLATVSSTEVYVDAETIVGLEATAAEVDLRPIDGGRLTLRPFPTVTVRRFAEEIDGLRVAPWPRVFVDLRNAGVRGEEAAEHLREVVHDR